MKRTRIQPTQHFVGCLAVLLVAAATAHAQITVTSESNAPALAEALTAGSGLSNVSATISSPVGTNTVSTTGLYTLTYPPFPGPYNLTANGILLTTGSATDFGTSGQTTSNFTSYGEPATAEQNVLLSPITGATEHFDVTELTLTFDVPESVSNLAMTVVFGSREFPSNLATDGMGIFLNGSNVGLVGGQPLASNREEFLPLPGTALTGVLAPNSNAAQRIVFPVVPGSVSNTLTFIIGNGSDPFDNTTAFLSPITASGVATAGVDLVVNKNGGNQEIRRGENITYTVTILNLGTTTATGVQLVDELPNGLTYQSATPETGSCTESNGTIICDLGDLAPNTNLTVSIVAATTQQGEVSNSVSVTANEEDDNPANNTASAVNQVGRGGGIKGGPTDLTAAWGEINLRVQPGRNNRPDKCKMRVPISIANLSENDARNTRVRVYVSSDPVLDDGDQVLREIATGKIKAESSRVRRVTAKFDCSVLDGQFLIAQIDPEGQLDETDTENNVIVIGPINTQAPQL